MNNLFMMNGDPELATVGRNIILNCDRILNNGGTAHVELLVELFFEHMSWCLITKSSIFFFQGCVASIRNLATSCFRSSAPRT